MEKETELKPWLRSSVDPTQVSNRVRGLIIASGSFIVLIAGKAGQEILPTDIDLIANQVSTLAFVAGSAFGLAQTAYGALMALVMRFGKK